MAIFKHVWKTCFFDDMYINQPITYEGNKATWIATNSHVFDSLSSANMTKDYSCGQAIRNGVMKAPKLHNTHSIEESLVNDDNRCVIKVLFDPEK
ncbi:hypothetical protein [Pseudodesulfovibrio sediminis]|uniref:Uncharacterized protein n=1 Tax=Pseudodesulfovibrio sediminis TaxID=2810563 RepID=A0ABM9SE90_9BACT|nr:hypothetical protein [Pseudodesulfovibrio sediminis]BCS88043.1 hypothetical protein PSDVSF_12850 [Pseudodesulfovibrio sediminis]